MQLCIDELPTGRANIITPSVAGATWSGIVIVAVAIALLLLVVWVGRADSGDRKPVGRPRHQLGFHHQLGFVWSPIAMRSDSTTNSVLRDQLNQLYSRHFQRLKSTSISSLSFKHND